MPDGVEGESWLNVWSPRYNKSFYGSTSQVSPGSFESALQNMDRRAKKAR